jgi:oxygen-independent coproporphyrinogen-3 oxidase
MAGRARRHVAVTGSPAIGLYVHVPFCAAICPYCNFSRGLLDDGLKRRYVSAVVAEIRRAPARRWPGRHRPAADTVFFGGGTPSLLDPAEIASILDACRETFGVGADAEVTVEANPETVTAASLAAYRHAGVNRLSVGVQSFRDDELRLLGRIHDAARARQAVADARSAGFENLSLDLMMWLPGQTMARWEESIEGLRAADPEHASLYMLELYPTAPLRAHMARAGIAQAPDDVAADMYEWAMEALDASGYRQYEISNVARPGRESRHNLKYWTDGEWLGFGPGAHSTIEGARWKNVSATGEYIARVEDGADTGVERRDMTAVERWQEAVIMGLRLRDGLCLESIAMKYGLDLWAGYGDHLQPYVDAGLLLHVDGRLRLSRRGMLVSNDVFAVFI